MTTNAHDHRRTAAKQLLREAVLRDRDALSDTQRAVDALACETRLLQLPAFQNAKTVLSYMSFGSELNTHAILRQSLQRGKAVVLPRMVKPSGAQTLPELAIHQVLAESDLTAGPWGILEPHANSAAATFATVDLVLVPGVAFDRRGRRLGYGKGYYDRLLPARRANCLLVALAFDFQLVDEVPVSAHDVSIDLLITPSQQFSFTT
jgi:5-formyltetrahydrofolate cyclo-ligase